VSTTTDARVARTAAAATAGRPRAAGRAARELAGRLEHLDDDRLQALAGLLATEARDRGLVVRYVA
jgi:hypothetical protein